LENFLLNNAIRLKITTLLFMVGNSGGEGMKVCGCVSGEVEVVGEYCSAVRHECKKWISRSRDRCLEYEAKSKCIGDRKAISVCMDKYEWPNIVGERPMVGMNYNEAEGMCRGVGKRLCTAEEWTKGCEGEENWPYPDGWVRGSCNVD